MYTQMYLFPFCFREVNKLSGKSTGKRAQACDPKLWLTYRATQQ